MFSNETTKTPAQRMLERADKILASVEESYIITDRGHKQRLMPVFRPDEISLGAVLGSGGFGIVHEIKKFTLDPEEENEQQVNQESEATPNHPSRISKVVSTPEELSFTNHIHYDVKKARHWMEKRCIRKGVPRFALKRLHGDLSELELARGMIDLAVEAKYLSVVWHPNIIKVRGIAKGPIVDKGFFIIMDRLHGTLDGRINTWYHNEKRYHGTVFGIGKNSKVLRDLMIERMTIAYDMAAAFMYLHENRLVYRDIKPENIGFDSRGDVKVFDFGLCKSLSSKLKSRDGYGYRLTGRAGSLPYMAPEVVKMETYDSKCDVFSFAILLWEILSLRQCCKDFTPTQFVERVVVKNERFPIKKCWPPLTRLMLPEAWDPDPRKRPDMKRVAILIRGDLNDMTNDDKVIRRTKHMNQRSQHSFNEEVNDGGNDGAENGNQNCEVLNDRRGGLDTDKI